MSIKVMNCIWECAPYREGTLLVLLAMADWANDQGGRIFPSVSTLAQKARLATRATQSALRRLEADGVIECVKRATGRPGSPNEYRINLERVQQLHGCTNCTRATSDKEARGSKHLRVHLATAHKRTVNKPSSEPSPLSPKGSDLEVQLSRRADFNAFLTTGGRLWQNAALRSTEQAWLNVEHEIPPAQVLASCMEKFWAGHQAEEKRLGKPKCPLGPARFLREGQWRRFIAIVEVDPTDWSQIWGGDPAVTKLASQIGPGAVNAWFKGTALKREGAEIVIRVPSRTKRDQIASRFIMDLARAFGIPRDDIRIETDFSLVGPIPPRRSV